MVCATGITKSFHASHSVWRDVSFSLPAASSMAVLGSLHSGKTTLIRILAGLETLSGGQLSVFGHALDTCDESERALYRREVIGFVSPDIPWLPHFHLQDNVALPLLIANMSRREAKQQVLDLCQLLRLSTATALDSLTPLERQWWSLARGLIRRPKLLLIDDLDTLGNEVELFIEQLFELLPILNTTLIFTTQHPRVAAYAEHIFALASVNNISQSSLSYLEVRHGVPKT